MTTTTLLQQPFYAPPPWTLSGTTWVGRYQKGKTNLDLLIREENVEIHKKTF